MTTSTNALLEAALAFAAKGLPVFPCGPNKKPRTKHGFKDATTDHEQVREWWRNKSDSLIGVPTGMVSGIAVLDLDVKNGKNGLAAVLNWEVRSPLIARTPSGGVHLYFRAEGAPGCTSDVIERGVDTRGDGGYVIVPPSPGYMWSNGHDLATTELQLPSWPNDLRPVGKAQPENAGSSEPEADPIRVAAALAVIPNNDLGWDPWNRIGMAIWAATGGSDEGLEAYHAWSAKSVKYDERTTDERWDGITRSPPREIGAGTLVFEATKADPDWRRRFDALLEDNIRRVNAGEKLRPLSVREVFDHVALGVDQQDAPLDQSDGVPPNDGETSSDEKTAEQPKKEPLLKSSAEFVADFVPPDYLIDQLLQRRFIYSLTGRTGSGKTCVALRLAAHVALGLPFARREVEKGKVLFFAGENPDDVRSRWIKLCEHMKINPNDLDVFFIDGVKPISKATIRTRIDNEALDRGPFALVIIDTSAAYFAGKDENDNVEAGEHARMLRSFTDLSGGPSVLVTCHPIKNPDPDNLLPRGGGAFLAEVDGNLVCRSERGSTLVQITWHGKFRGPDFDPFHFKIVPSTSDKLKDTKGRSIWTVFAEPITEAERGMMEEVTTQRNDELLRAMSGRESIAEFAGKMGWKYKSGEPNKSLVHRELQAALKGGLAEKKGQRYTRTKKGDKYVAELNLENSCGGRM